MDEIRTGHLQQHGRIKRLSPEFYRGYAFVHWSMTMAGRREGWLDADLHRHFREVQLHTLSRYELLCPVYCLMPDHLHFVWFGVSEASDQDRAASFFRRFFNAALKAKGQQLQKQPWDTVLREKGRERGAVVSACFYVAENPVRAGLVPNAAEWPFSGSLAAGYPDFDWRQKDFAERLWTIYAAEVKRKREMGPLRGREDGEPERRSGTACGSG
jgi:REP element-mobilizing transposase RayT